MTQFQQLHLGGTAVHPEGTAVAITLPLNTHSIYMKADGDAYYNVGTAVAAGTTTMGYIPADTADMVFTAENLATISFSAAAGVTVYVQYYSA